MIETPYTPIDWQLDFKSGYRWSEKAFFKQITYQRYPGVDIKVPWELGRMQHLPQMALYQNSLAQDADERRIIQREIRNQILDFIAMNPPCFGVQWVSSMEVAIRAANWLMTLDILNAGGHQYDKDFSGVISQSIIQHAKHIRRHLSKTGTKRHNHYLVEICGLAIISAYFPPTKQSNTWFKFSIHELINEVQHQFLPDGINFEGSTAYHRFTAECVYFATAFVLACVGNQRNKTVSSAQGLEECPFPAWYFEKLERMAGFMAAIRKPDGTFPQIGDNDNGRLFKLDPTYSRLSKQDARRRYFNLSALPGSDDMSSYLMENHLDGDHLIESACALFRRPDLKLLFGGSKSLTDRADYSILRHLTKGIQVASQRGESHLPQQAYVHEMSIDDTLTRINAISNAHKRVHVFLASSHNLCDDLQLSIFRDFGLYIYRSNALYMAVRCWNGASPFTSGHRHYDQLSIELVIDGDNLIADPGTYVYTPLPEGRNQYRSSSSHFVPFPWDHAESGLAQERQSVFGMSTPIPKGEILFCDTKQILCKAGDVQRWILIANDHIRVTDIYANSIPEQNFAPVSYSPGYGILMNSNDFPPLSGSAA